MADDDTSTRVPDPESATFGGRDLIGLGGVLVGTVVGGMLLGLFIDKQAESSPVFTLAGIAVGVVLGAISFVLRVRRALRG